MFMTDHFENTASRDNLAERLERAEAALRERKIDLQLMVDSIPAQVAVMDPSGEVETLNRPCLDYFGRTLDELKEWANSDPVHPEDLPRVIEVRRNALESGATYEVEARHRRHDGVYRWFDVRGFPLKDADGRILRWCVLLTDIDDRKRAEAALQASERNLRELTDAIPTVIHVLNADGSVRYVNQPVMDYTGFTRDEVLREDYRARVFHPDDLKRINDERRDSLARPELFENEQRAIGRDGNYRWFLARYKPLLNDAGEIDRWYVASFDIEDRKRAEAMLAGEKRLLEMIAGGKPLPFILGALCRFVEETASDCKCGIYLIDWTGPTFQVGAAPGLPPTFNDPLEGLAVTDSAGPCGLAALTGAQVIAEDLESDAEWQECGIRPLALRHGLRAQWSTPICSRDGSVLGTFAVFQMRPARPTQIQQDLIAQVTHIASIAIERGRNEEALKRGERELKLTVDTIPALVWSAGPDGSADFFNQHYLDYLGLSAEEAKGSGWTIAVHPDDLNGLMTAWQQITASEKPGETEGRLRRHDGVYRWFLFRANPFRDEQGIIVKWYGANTDIEDSKRAQEALAANERDLRSMINTIPTHIYVLNTDGSVQHVNEAVTDYTGLTLENVQQADYRDRVIHPEDFKRVRAERAAALRRAAPFSTEQRVLGTDGQYRWFLVRYKPELDEHGKIVRWYVAAFDIEDRKRAEAERKQTEETFRMIVETNPECVKVIDRDGTLLRVNAAGLTMSGAPSEEIILGQCFYDFLAPEDRDRYREFNEKVCSGHKGFLEFDIINMQGQRHHMETHAAPMLNADGSFVQLGVTRDITESKLTLKRLQSNQDLLDLAQKSAGAMAFDWYIQREINSWSPDQEALFGLPPGGFDGTYQSWKRMMYAPDWPIVVDAINHAHETGQVTAEYRVVWPDGSLHWLSTNGRMFFDDAGQPLRMVGFTSDVTKRKLIEEELRRSEAFLAEAQRLSLTGSFSWRPDTDVMTFSEQARRIFEFDPDENVTLALIGSRVHPDDRPATNERIGRAREHIVDQDFENRLLLPDGSIKYIHTIARVMQREDGGTEYIGAIQDITDRLRSEIALSEARSELAQAARAMSLGVLTAAIAHEVNQPLSGIVMNASTCIRMLDADPPNLQGARETAQRTIRDGHRAADVIARLRALFTKKDLTFEAVDLNEAAREVIALSLSELQKHRVVLQSEQAGNLPLVAGDRVQLQQVILNLVRNAIDALSAVEDRPRQLLVKTEPDGDQMVRLTVQDSGIGFDPQAQKSMFEAFYTTKNDGMGIGLSVSRSIIENHHGRIWATRNDGPGTAFSFAIPQAPPPDTKA